MYRRLRAFSPVELFVVVAVIALLIAILIPSCTRARELSKRTVCASNMRGIGQATYIYAQVGDRFPAMTDISEESKAVYFAYRMKPPKKGDTPSPTADLWAVVHANNTTPTQLICPSTRDLPDPAQDTLAYFDFRSGNNLSYAYQYMHDPDVGVLGTSDDPMMPILADANPYIKGRVTKEPKADRESESRGNSLNHTGREGQNVLYLDGHVDFNKAPDVGLPGQSNVKRNTRVSLRDNIYTVQDGDGRGDAGSTAGFPGKINLGKSDACLVP